VFGKRDLRAIEFARQAAFVAGRPALPQLDENDGAGDQQCGDNDGAHDVLQGDLARKAAAILASARSGARVAPASIGVLFVQRHRHRRQPVVDRDEPPSGRGSAQVHIPEGSKRHRLCALAQGHRGEAALPFLLVCNCDSPPFFEERFMRLLPAQLRSALVRSRPAAEPGVEGDS
jgi:hypothetical protein